MLVLADIELKKDQIKARYYNGKISDPTDFSYSKQSNKK